MNKWYRTCRWMLVAAVAIQLSGCARHRSWVSAGLAQQGTWLASFPLLENDGQMMANTNGATQPNGQQPIVAANQVSHSAPQLLENTPEPIESDPELDLDSKIAQSSGRGDQKQSAVRSSANGARSQVRKVASKAEVNADDLADLSEWENSGEKSDARAEIKRTNPAIKATAPSGSKKAVQSTEQVQRRPDSRKNGLTPVSSVSATNVRSNAGDLLSLCPNAQGELREQILALNTSDAEVLKHRLGRLGTDASAAPALEHLLNHKDGFVRMHAAFALARMQKSTPEGVRIVVDGLKSKDPGLRSFAAATIAEMGPQLGIALEAFAESLDTRDRDGNYRFEDAEVLIRVKPKRQASNNSAIGKLPQPDTVSAVSGHARFIEPVEIIEPEAETMEIEDETLETLELEDEVSVVRPRIQKTSVTTTNNFRP